LHPKIFWKKLSERICSTKFLILSTSRIQKISRSSFPVIGKTIWRFFPRISGWDMPLLGILFWSPDPNLQIVIPCQIKISRSLSASLAYTHTHIHWHIYTHIHIHSHTHSPVLQMGQADLYKPQCCSVLQLCCSNSVLQCVAVENFYEHMHSRWVRCVCEYAHVWVCACASVVSHMRSRRVWKIQTKHTMRQRNIHWQEIRKSQLFSPCNTVHWVASCLLRDFLDQKHNASRQDPLAKILKSQLSSDCVR